MPWLQVTTAGGQRDPEPIEAAFTELGAVATWLSDAGDNPVLEPAPGETPLWPEVVVTALFPADTDTATVLAAMAELLPAAALHFRQLEDEDWQSNWQRSLRPLQFGERLWVLPDAAHHAPAGNAFVRLAPGLAFGTGEHPTTAMCLRWLTERPLAELTVLDYGCGSGLLALAALALGASAAIAVDIDPQALTATAANAAANGCAGRLQTGRPEEFPDAAGYDLLVANILSGTLIELAPALAARLRSGADIALTGILSEQAAAVCAAWSPWAPLQVSAQQDNWVLLTGHKRHG